MSWITRMWCSLTHGGGTVTRDATGCINWQCAKCGRWSTPVPLEDEQAAVGDALRITRMTATPTAGRAETATTTTKG